MRLLAYLTVMLLSHMAMGQLLDPPPLDLNPLSEDTPGTEGAASGVSLAPTISDDAPTTPQAATANEGRIKGKPVEKEKTRVAVLGYHNFSETKSVTRMLMRTSELRSQMERIRQSGYTVISMQEFLEWRFGDRLLPEKCILITLDDGWRSVYTDAYPIFKEYGYPFHLFLYTGYLSGAGDSMTPDMIQEMQQNGASIGSHSATHPYPSDWKKAQKKGETAYNAMLDREIGETRHKLGSMFGPINTYCYPGGYNDAAMHTKLQEHGYTAAFTVLPGKVDSQENALAIDRYMILGTDPRVFEDAMDFATVVANEGLATGYIPGALPRNTPAPTFSVTPQPNSTVPTTIPTISADLSELPNVDLDTVEIKVSGFGTVPHSTNKSERTVQWTAPCRIYMPLLSVHISWKTTDGTSHRAAWSFLINRAVTAD